MSVSYPVLDSEAQLSRTRRVYRQLEPDWRTGVPSNLCREFILAVEYGHKECGGTKAAPLKRVSGPPHAMLEHTKPIPRTVTLSMWSRKHQGSRSGLKLEDYCVIGSENVRRELQDCGEAAQTRGELSVGRPRP